MNSTPLLIGSHMSRRDSVELLNSELYLLVNPRPVSGLLACEAHRDLYLVVRDTMQLGLCSPVDIYMSVYCHG